MSRLICCLALIQSALSEITSTNLIIIDQIIFLIHPLIELLEIKQPQCINLPSFINAKQHINTVT